MLKLNLAWLAPRRAQIAAERIKNPNKFGGNDNETGLIDRDSIKPHENILLSRSYEFSSSRFQILRWLSMSIQALTPSDEGEYFSFRTVTSTSIEPSKTPFELLPSAQMREEEHSKASDAQRQYDLVAKQRCHS